MYIEEIYKLWRIKTTSSSGILKTIYHSDSCLYNYEKEIYIPK